MKKQAYHGGAFFQAIGEDFSTLEKYTDIISADVLDGWFNPSPKVLKKIKQFLPFILRTSPPTHSDGLKDMISYYRNIPRENILMSGGSSDIMFTFFPNVLKKGDCVLILDPMYGEYSHIFNHVLDVKLHLFKLRKENSFIVNLDNLLKEIKLKNPKMVVLVNPNSPTGQYIPKKELVSFLRNISKKTIVVIDETYIDYIDSSLSLEVEVCNFSNLAIIKSMSKAYALSGARIGYLVADQEIINQVMQFVPPWSVSLIGQIAAIEALKDTNYYHRQYSKTNNLRKMLVSYLQKIPDLKIYNSQANFILAEILNDKVSSEVLVSELRKENIYIRNCDSMSKQFHNRFIRIAVKDSKTNKLIARAVQKFFNTYNNKD